MQWYSKHTQFACLCIAYFILLYKKYALCHPQILPDVGLVKGCPNISMHYWALHSLSLFFIFLCQFVGCMCYSHDTTIHAPTLDFLWRHFIYLFKLASRPHAAPTTIKTTWGMRCTPHAWGMVRCNAFICSLFLSLGTIRIIFPQTNWIQWTNSTPIPCLLGM